MPLENSLFLPVKDYCRRDFHTCRLDASVQQAAALMQEHNSDSIIVCDGNDLPVGIVTDRDLRGKVVAEGRDPSRLQVEQIMSGPVIAVTADKSFFEVLYQMSHHRIHRVGIVDDSYRLIGMINESDIIRLQSRSPQALLNKIDAAESIEELKARHRDLNGLIAYLFETGVRTYDLVRLISLLNDQTLLRLIQLLTRDRFTDLPSGFAFLVLGSEGRREQTLKTDQDNAIIYADDLSPAEIAQIDLFSEVLIDSLIEIGVPECPGGIMAKNKPWRRSFGEWRELIDGWIGTPTNENILNFSMFSDMRALWGDSALEDQLRSYIIQRAGEESLFIARMAANVCKFDPPLGFFGGFKVEKNGDQAGRLDLKKAGIFALAEGIKVLGLEAGDLGGSTREKLERLEAAEVLAGEQAEELLASFNLLSFLRLREQLAAQAEGRAPSNHIDPKSLNRIETARFKGALEVVKSLQTTLKSHFRLSNLSD